jgi:hypothetical protein
MWRYVAPIFLLPNKTRTIQIFSWDYECANTLMDILLFSPGKFKTISVYAIFSQSMSSFFYNKLSHTIEVSTPLHTSFPLGRAKHQTLFSTSEYSE